MTVSSLDSTWLRARPWALPLLVVAAACFVAAPAVAQASEPVPPPPVLAPPAPVPPAPQPPEVVPPVQAPVAPAVENPLPEAKPAPKPKPKLPKMVRLSDERKETKWAHSETRGIVFRSHSLYSARIGRLRIYTEDRFPEVYIALREYTDVKHRTWVKIRLPKRPNGRTGWVLRSALGPYRTNRQQLVVNRVTLRATLYYRGKPIWSARVGVGTSSTRTPAGRFYVREKFRFKNSPAYGTRAIGTSAYAPTLSDWPGGGVIGIHGTNQPALIPGRPSHGCVRVKNPDIARLYRRIQIGTPILVR